MKKLVLVLVLVLVLALALALFAVERQERDDWRNWTMSKGELPF